MGPWVVEGRLRTLFSRPSRDPADLLADLLADQKVGLKVGLLAVLLVAL